MTEVDVTLAVVDMVDVVYEVEYSVLRHTSSAWKTHDRPRHLHKIRNCGGDEEG
jgi:hypothetical protein